MWAILSDVHANLEALTAVLADAGRHHASRLVCLGDVLGYGPDPLPCVDLIRQRCEVAVLGNHDQAAMFDPEWFSGPAQRAIFWHRACLEQGDRATCEARWAWLAERPRSWSQGPWLFLHGTPRNPLNEYLFPEDVYNGRKMERNFDLMQHVCFTGHSHVPGVFLHLRAGFDPKTHVPFKTPGEPAFDFIAPEGAQTIQL